MKQLNPSAVPEAWRRSVNPTNTPLDEQLLDVYWAKKELDEFLPKIATYATPDEVTAIALAQLAMMEKQIIRILQEMSQ
jgi:hypothetical protein